MRENGEASLSTRQGRILIVSLTLGAAALVAAAWWYYTRQRDAAETAAENELTAICRISARCYGAQTGRGATAHD